MNVLHRERFIISFFTTEVYQVSKFKQKQASSAIKPTHPHTCHKMEYLQIVENIKSSTALTKHRPLNIGREGGGEKSWGGTIKERRGCERLLSVEFRLDKLASNSGRCSSLIDQGLLSGVPKVLRAKQDRGQNTHFIIHDSEDSDSDTHSQIHLPNRL